jgi:hypothetical protein
VSWDSTCAAATAENGGEQLCVGFGFVCTTSTLGAPGRFTFEGAGIMLVSHGQVAKSGFTAPAMAPQPSPIDVLGDMFTAVIAATNAPGRAHLADVVEYCHARRALGLDTRAMPVVFYTQTDVHLQAITLRHLPHAPHLRLPPGGSEGEGRKASNSISNFAHPAFEEQTLAHRMDPETRVAYVRTRYHLDRLELAALGAQYLDYLEDPSVHPEPQPSQGEDICSRPCPLGEAHFNPQLGKHDYEEEFLMGESADADSFYTDEEDNDDDENDEDDSDSDAGSEYTEMSLVTQESDAVEIFSGNQLERFQTAQLQWAREQTSKPSDAEAALSESQSAYRSWKHS